NGPWSRRRGCRRSDIERGPGPIAWDRPRPRDMALEQKLNLRLSQRLIMTPSLQQAIKLLQMTKLELQEEVTQELTENPLLEELLEGPPEAERTEQEEAGGEGAEAGDGEAQVSEARDAAEKEKDCCDVIEYEEYLQEYIG